MKTVFLHGLGQTAQDWKEVVQQLSISDVDCCSRSKFLSYFLIFFVKNFHITLFHFTEKRSYFFVVKQRFKEILYTDRG